jgi:hypothetical protein
VVAPVHQHDLHRRLGQLAGQRDAAEAGTDDHHPGAHPCLVAGTREDGEAAGVVVTVDRRGGRAGSSVMGGTWSSVAGRRPMLPALARGQGGRPDGVPPRPPCRRPAGRRRRPGAGPPPRRGGDAPRSAARSRSSASSGVGAEPPRWAGIHQSSPGGPAAAGTPPGSWPAARRCAPSARPCRLHRVLGRRGEGLAVAHHHRDVTGEALGRHLVSSRWLPQIATGTIGAPVRWASRTAPVRPGRGTKEGLIVTPGGCRPPRRRAAAARRSPGRSGSPCTSTGIWPMVRMAQPTTRFSKMSCRAMKRTCRRGRAAPARRSRSRGSRRGCWPG